MFRKKKNLQKIETQSASQQFAESPTPKTQGPIESFEDSIARRFGKPLRSALSPGTVIQGKLSFDTPVIIEGKLGGEVYSTDTLIVGKQGRIEAQVRAKNMIVAGTVTGPVELSGYLEIASGGRFEGDFTAASFVIKDGGIFNGNCRMTSKAAVKAPETVSETPSAEKSITAGAHGGSPANAAANTGHTVVAQTNMSPEELKQAAEHAKRNITEKKSDGAAKSESSAGANASRVAAS